MVRVAPWLVAAVLVSAPDLAQPGTIQAAPGLGPQAPPRDTSVRTGTARIRGHVFASDTGAPLRRVQVRAFSPETRENRLAITDPQGAYEFKDLPAGRYNLSASKGTFVSLQYGQTRPFEPGKPLQILDGQTLEKVDFSLPRGSVITGRILDEFGEPTADVVVMPMRYQYQQGRRRLVPVGGRSSPTNDIGEFRIFALAPGKYYLSATLRGVMGMAVDGSSDDRSGYAPTYYPGTPNPAEAQLIEVPLGGIVSDVTIALVQTRTARVSGSAVDASGKPLAGGFLMAMQRNGPMAMQSGGGQIRPDGSFVVSGLAPGDYTLRAYVAGVMAGEAGESVTANITVSGEDVTGVQLVATRPVTATGRLVVDPETAKAMNPSTLRIQVTPANPEDIPLMNVGGGRVNDDLTFEIRTHPGTHMLRLGGQREGTGWLLAVRYNGLDVTDTGIEFRANQDVSGIEIELTNHPSEVAGLATTARGEPSNDYTVIVFAQDAQRRGFMSRYFGIGRPDQDGRFRVRNLPPGSYYAIALDHVDMGEASDPEFLDRIQNRATSFALNDGEAKVLDLKVLPAP